MAPVDEGRWIYITNFIEDTPLAYFARVEEGRIQRKHAPQGFPKHLTFLHVRDAKGNLWVPNAMRTGSSSWARHAMRIDPKRKTFQFKGYGHPVGHDGAGNLLLYKRADLQTDEPDRLYLARDQKIIQQIAWPSSLSEPPFASDRPGSVFTINLRGLVHLVADDPLKPVDPYRVARIYRLPTRGRVTGLLASGRKFLTVLVEADNRLWLYTLSLPIKAHRKKEQ